MNKIQSLEIKVSYIQSRLNGELGVVSKSKWISMLETAKKKLAEERAKETKEAKS